MPLPGRREVLDAVGHHPYARFVVGTSRKLVGVAPTGCVLWRGVGPFGPVAHAPTCPDVDPPGLSGQRLSPGLDAAAPSARRSPRGASHPPECAVYPQSRPHQTRKEPAVTGVDADEPLDASSDKARELYKVVRPGADDLDQWVMCIVGAAEANRGLTGSLRGIGTGPIPFA